MSGMRKRPRGPHVERRRRVDDDDRAGRWTWLGPPSLRRMPLIHWAAMLS